MGFVSREGSGRQDPPFYTKLYLQDDILVKVDRASMLNSLEVRSPYLDIEIVDFARRLPNHFKYRRGTTKYILKKALESVLPPDIWHIAQKRVRRAHWSLVQNWCATTGCRAPY